MSKEENNEKTVIAQWAVDKLLDQKDAGDHQRAILQTALSLDHKTVPESCLDNIKSTLVGVYDMLESIRENA